MATRLPPKTMAKKLVRVLRAQHPDYPYLKKVFQHTRELLDVSPAPQTTRLPELLTEAELVAFYDAVWHARQLTHGACSNCSSSPVSAMQNSSDSASQRSISRPVSSGSPKARVTRIGMSFFL
jgi:hypothetical protein